MAETSQGLLVRGVPLNVDECTATDRLQIHFQRTVISGADGEVNSVYSHAGSATERAFVVVFKNGKEAVQTVLEKEKRVHKVNFDGKPVQLEVTAIPLDLQTGAVLSSRLIMADKPDQTLTQAGEQSESEGENNLRNLSQTGQQWDGHPGFTQQPGGNSTMYPPHSGNYNFAGASEAQDPNLSTTSEGSDQLTDMATPPRSLIGPGGAVRQPPLEGDFHKQEPDPNMQYLYGQQQYPSGWNQYQPYPGMYQPQPQMPPGYNQSYPNPYQQYGGWYPGYQQSYQPEPNWAPPNQQPGQNNQPGPNWAPPPYQQPGLSHQQDDSSHQLSQEVIQKYIQSLPPDQQASLQRCPPEYVTMSFHSLPPDRKEFFLRKEQPEDQNSQEKDGHEDSINIEACTLAVTGFEPGTSADVLEMYFENKKKSGGGQVKKLELKDGTVFLVTFESEEVAEHVINHGTHVLKNKPLTVQWFKPEKEEREESTAAAVTCDSAHTGFGDAAQLDPCKLQVTGFMAGTSQDTLELYFESKRKSGGGPFVESEFLDDETFVIKFETREVAEGVINHGAHVLKNKPLTVQWFKPEKEEREEPTAAAVTCDSVHTGFGDTVQLDPCKLQVTGFMAGTSQETLELYFESKRKSGGGPYVESDMLDDETFVIKFETREVAERVLSQENHNWEGSTLTVQQFVPSVKQPDEKDMEGAVHVDPCKLQVTGFKTGTSKETLELYFESKRKSGGGPFIEAEMIDEGTFVITFDNSEVAERVLSKEDHNWEGSTLTVQQFVSPENKKASSAVQVDPCKLQVTGFKKGTSKEILELYFESKRKSGGGSVVESEMRDNGTFVIEFESSEVAERVLSQENHNLEGSILTVKQFVLSVKQPDKKDKQGTVQVHTCKLLVTGFKRGTSLESLELYFESKRKSGGGPVLQSEMIDDGTCVIAFKSSEVAEQVLNRQEHKLGGSTLTVKQYVPSVQCIDTKDEEESDQEEEANCTIEVRGFTEETGTDTLELYFESKRSGGGPIESSQIINDVMIITFESPDVVARVLKKNHKVSGVKLTVKEPAKKKKKPKLPRDTKSFLLRGLAEGTSRENLELYLENCTGMDDEEPELFFGEEPDVVLVRYPVEIKDYENIMKRITKKKLNKAKIGMEPVYLTNCILVTNVPSNCTEDTIELYFESTKKSGGGEVVEVEVNTEKNTALVSFKDYKVLESVLSRQHTLSKKSIQVQPYYECLGEVVSRDEPPARIPDPMTLKGPQFSVLSYIMSKQELLSELKQTLSKVYAQHEWPAEGKDNAILLIPNFPKNVENQFQKCKAWPKEVETALTTYLKNFKCIDIPVLEGIWLQVISQKDGWARGDVDVVEDQDSSQLFISGRTDSVDQVEDRVKRVIKDIEEQMQKAKQMIKDTSKLNGTKIKQLMMCSFAKMVMHKFPDVTVKLTPKHNQVTFEGLPNDVTSAKCEMYETLSNMPKMRIKAKTQSQLHFLQQASASQKIYDMFKERKVQAVYFVENDEVVLSAMKENVLKQACEILSSSITEEKMTLKPRSLPAIQKQEWNSLVQKLEDEHTLTIVIPRHNQHAVLVTGFETSVKSVLAQLQDYIALNTEVDESVKIENGRMQYIQTYAKDEISNIQQGAKRLPLRMNIQSKGHFVILTISGTEDDVKIAAKELQQLADSVCRRPYPIDKPGMAKLFTGDKGKSYLKMTELKFKCIIDVNNPSEEDSVMPGSIHEEDFEEINVPKAQPTTYHILCYYTLKDRRRIVVGKGDLTKMHVDVIVNAANTRLDFSTGRLAKAVADAGGPEMQTDCAQIIKSRGRLFEGQAVSTGAGNLPCKSVVHAVAPVWHGSGYRGWSRQDETNKAELLLTDAVRNSLEVAEKMGHTSIAIPAIGAGGNRFPLDLCVKTILEAVDSYCRMNKPKSLMEIRIVDNADTTCQKFQDTLVEQYGSSNVVITSDEKSEDWQMAPSHSGEDMEKQEGFSTGAGFQSKNNPNVFKTTEDKYITMIKDSIAKQKVDVIVNTAQTSLDLNTGAVSKAILRVAGPQLQQEVDIQKTEVSTNEGDIVVTIATGNLKCKKVFHVLCCQWDSSGKAEKLLKSVMQQCFDIADKSGMKSIAFPAIGTGGLKFPRDVTAKIMYDEAKNFSASKPKSQLTDIKFVIYDQDHETIMAFQDVITNLTGVPLRKRHQRRSPAKHDGAKKMSKKKKVHSFSPMQSPQYSLNTTAVQHHSTAGTGQNVFTSFKKSKYQWEIMIRNICVQVQRGDITAETTEAIVNSTNENLDLSRGEMSKAIMQAGGRSIVDECKMLGRQPPGAVVITGAGKLRCNHIIHVVAVTEQTLEQSIMGILQLAEQNGIISLSMPAIGTGGLGIDSNDVASKTFHVIGDFVQQVYPQNLKLIRITIFQPHIVGIFQQAMSDLLITPRAQDDRGSMEEWFGAIGSAIRQAFMGPDKEEQTVLRKQFNTIILYIYAGSQQDINGAIKHLEATMDQEFSDVVIVEDASVRKLSKEDMSNLNTLADSLNVKVYMVDTGSVSRLYIQGGPMDVMTVHKQVNVLLERIHDEERPESEAKLLAQNVRWLFLNDKEEFEEYDELTTGIIEKAFQHNKSDIILNIEEGQYKIDFKKMMESDLDNPILSVVEVRRELKEAGFSLPSSWTTMRSGKQVERVVLDPKSKEYDTVAKHFRQTMKSLPFQTIHQIERIQNPKLYHQYMVLKQNMEAKNKAGTQNERLLYHGTSADTVPKINAGGFNRSFAGKNANVYGEGSYFAVNASYSAHDTYSPPDGSRKKHMYQAKVLTGEVTTGSRGMLIAPSKNQNDPTDCYDSVVDNQQNPALFVLFNDAMAYPEYLIVFQ